MDKYCCEHCMPRSPLWFSFPVTPNPRPQIEVIQMCMQVVEVMGMMSRGIAGKNVAPGGGDTRCLFLLL